MIKISKFRHLNVLAMADSRLGHLPIIPNLVKEVVVATSPRSLLKTVSSVVL